MVKYDPISIGKGNLTIAMNMDIQLDYVPMFLLKILCKKFSTDMIKKVKNVSENFEGSIW